MKIEFRAMGVAIITITGAWLVGCGAEATEPTESSTSELNPSCFDTIDAPVGSAQWRAELDACIAAATKKSGTPNNGSSQSQSCRTGIQCTNGACVCTDGPRKGQSCVGSSSTAANSCSVACKVCD
jgi:hypothetical protein